MAPPAKLGAVETQAAYILPDPVDQHAGAAPPASILTDRVETRPSAPPRLGVLQRIGGAIRNALSSLFCVRQAPPARTSRSEQRQSSFTQSLRKVRDELRSPDATSETISDALLNAAAAAGRLREEDGSPRELSQLTFQTLFQNASGAELNALAITLGKATVADAQGLVAHDANAVKILIGLEEAVNAECARRVESNIEHEIRAALDVMNSGGSPTLITDHLHLAFAATAPLIRSGVQSTSPEASHESDKAVEQAILDHLQHAGEDPAMRDRLLTHLSHRDLVRLATAAQSSNTLEGSPLAKEIAERPQRLATDLRERTSAFQKNYAPGSKVDRTAFLRDLSSIAHTARALEVHRNTFDRDRKLDTDVLEMRTEIGRAVDALITAGDVDLADLSRDQLHDLGAAHTALGSPSKKLDERLSTAQQNELRSRADALSGSLTKLFGALTSTHDPSALLDALSETAHAARVLDDTRRAFNAHARQLEPAMQTDRVYMQWLNSLSEQEQQSLAAALAGPNGEPLKADLDEAESVARKMQNVALADELKHMSITLLRLQTRVRSNAGSPSAAAPPAKASEAMRQSLNRRYGLKITGDHPVLNAGHFNAEQTRTAAAILEAPPSESEAQLEKLGTHAVSPQFLADARRRTPRISIAEGTAGAREPQSSRGSSNTRASTPLIDYDKWSSRAANDDSAAPDGAPAEPVDPDPFIAAGYERLIAFCDGNEEQARTLTQYLHQMLPVGVVRACAGEDSPLQLEDGRAGWIMEGSPDSKENGARVAVDIVLSKGDNGQPQLDVTYRCEGRHTLAPVDGSRPIQLSSDSEVEIRFRAELDHGSLKLMGVPSYQFALKADDFQKSYPPPTSASVRRALATEDSLTETLAWCQTRGQDYQITALRAADAFKKRPTIAHAAAVIAECDRGGEKGASLVSPEIRQKIAAAEQDRRQGVLAAFDGASKAAKIAMKAADYSEEGGKDFAHAEQFLEQLKQLDSKSGPALLEAAERLYREFIEPPAAEGSERSGDRRTLPLDTEIAEQTRRLLAAERQAAAQAAFSPDLFDAVADTLAHSLDTEVLPGMVDAVKRGEI